MTKTENLTDLLDAIKNKKDILAFIDGYKEATAKPQPPKAG